MLISIIVNQRLTVFTQTRMIQSRSAVLVLGCLAWRQVAAYVDPGIDDE
jgi:hypothetical protein